MEKELMYQLLQGIREGNVVQAMEATQRWNKLPLQGKVKDPCSEKKIDLVSVETLVIYILHEQGVESSYLESMHRKYIQQIDELKSLESANTLAVSMISEYMDLRNNKSYQEYSPLVKTILIEVDRDLRQSLTLQFFAKKLNVNSSYLSDLFRREMGVTLTDYVTMKRINHAKDMLETTRQPVKNVAKLVGIEDVHYFSRVFKNRTGKTPIQYRMEAQKTV